MELQPLTDRDSDYARDDVVVDLEHHHSNNRHPIPRRRSSRHASSQLKPSYHFARYIFWAIVVVLLILNIAISSRNYAILNSSPQARVQISSPSLVSHKTPRNLIFMVTDGMGPSQLTFARQYLVSKMALAGEPSENNPVSLAQDRFLVGSSETISASSRVTDSAAGATAFSCGARTNNGHVGVLPSGEACGTVFEAAKAQHGYRIGTVSTSRVTHATPASFVAHVKNRNDENRIALQQIKNNRVDLLLGGGRRHFVPKETAGSKRRDSHDLTLMAQKNGVSYVNSAQGLKNAVDGRKLPLLGLFADSHMEYEVDREKSRAPGGGVQPSLANMTSAALEILTGEGASSSPPFMLLVEGSRIDMAAHANDALTMAEEILAFQEAFQVVVDYVEQHPDTLVISVSRKCVDVQCASVPCTEMFAYS